MIDHPLYQSVILKHNRSPQGFGALNCATHEAQGYSRLCGEHLDIYLSVSDGVINRAGFEGDVSAVAMAAASIMSQAIVNKTILELVSMTDDVVHFLRDPDSSSVASWITADSELSAFAVLSRYQSRKAAALLPWQTACKSLGEDCYDV